MSRDEPSKQFAETLYWAFLGVGVTVEIAIGVVLFRLFRWHRNRASLGNRLETVPLMDSYEEDKRLDREAKENRRRAILQDDIHTIELSMEHIDNLLHPRSMSGTGVDLEQQASMARGEIVELNRLIDSKLRIYSVVHISGEDQQRISNFIGRVALHNTWWMRALDRISAVYIPEQEGAKPDAELQDRVSRL